VEKDVIKVLVISDSPFAHVQGIWCFNYLSRKIKLGLISPKQLMINMNFVRLILKYLRIYTLTFFFAPKWDIVISTSFADGFGHAISQLFGLRRKTKEYLDASRDFAKSYVPHNKILTFADPATRSGDARAVNLG